MRVKTVKRLSHVSGWNALTGLGKTIISLLALFFVAILYLIK